MSLCDEQNLTTGTSSVVFTNEIVHFKLIGNIRSEEKDYNAFFDG